MRYTVGSMVINLWHGRFNKSFSTNWCLSAGCSNVGKISHLSWRWLVITKLSYWKRQWLWLDHQCTRSDCVCLLFYPRPVPVYLPISEIINRTVGNTDVTTAEDQLAATRIYLPRYKSHRYNDLFYAMVAILCVRDAALDERCAFGVVSSKKNEKDHDNTIGQTGVLRNSSTKRSRFTSECLLISYHRSG